MFRSYFERKNVNVLTKVLFIFLTLKQTPSTNKHHTSQFQNLISVGDAYYSKYGNS